MEAVLQSLQGIALHSPQQQMLVPSSELLREGCPTNHTRKSTHVAAFDLAANVKASSFDKQLSQLCTLLCILETVKSS